MTAVTARDTCRVCGSARLESFLSLGEQALANAFLSSADELASEPRFPLEVAVCLECGLVQLEHVVAPELLFRDYVYVSGTSATMVAHLGRYAESVVERLGLGADDLVVEIASNDGTLLRRFQERGVRTLGVEPARNVAARAREAGVDTVERFFGLDCAMELRREHGEAAAVVANNVLAHVDDPVDLLRGARALIGAGGRVFVEVPWLRELVERLEYDTIYHEHLSYFSVGALMRTCEEAGLRVEHVERVPVHGGSLRVIAAPVESLSEHTEGARALARAERDDGLSTLERLREFAESARASRTLLVDLLKRLRSQGKSLAGYGAPAKGSTLLGYCGIGPELLPYTVDRNPLKVGRFVPGAHVPVLPVETLLERQPDCVLILAWNLADEIARHQAEYLRRGGRFLVPIPRQTPAGPDFFVS